MDSHRDTHEFEARLRQVVEEVVDARCAQLVEELRRMVRDVMQEHGAAPRE